MNDIASNLIFDISTMLVMDGRELRSVQPDKDGVYCGIPLMVLGAVSRNNVEYEVTSTLAAMTNPNTRFYKNLTEGNLEGEFRHPIILNKEELLRITLIDRALVSHYIKRVRSQKTEDGKYYIVYGDIVPFGPYGQYLRDSFADPKRNTAFSLRSLCSVIGESNGVTKKRVAAMITFDHVDGSGYELSCKRFQDRKCISNESFSLMSKVVSIDDLRESQVIAKAVGFESINHQQLFDLLQTNTISVCQEVKAVFDERQKQLITPAGKKSIFHTMFDSRGN